MSRSPTVSIALLLAACGSDGGGGDGPSRIGVVVTASSELFSHGDDSAGQTAASPSGGVRRLTLFPDSGEPWAIVDRGTSAAIVDYAPGARTTVGVVRSKDVVLGRYTRARLVHDWLRFEVAATLHDVDGKTDGTLAMLMVTADGALIGDQPRGVGHYVHDFTASNGSKTGHWQGDDLVLPDYATSAGVEAKLEDGAWALYFPIDVEIDAGDGTLTITANTYQAFRWQDVVAGENQPNTYDIAPPTYEPTLQLGANALSASFEAR